MLPFRVFCARFPKFWSRGTTLPRPSWWFRRAARRKAKAIICPVSRCMIALAPLPQSLRFTGVRRLSDIPCTPAKRLCLQREGNIAMSTGRRCAGKGFSNEWQSFFQRWTEFCQRDFLQNQPAGQAVAHLENGFLSLRILFSLRWKHIANEHLCSAWFVFVRCLSP